ncbi:MAG: ABC transporter permease subunit [Hyphomicrobium sp.]|nr:ABC transporter permease subunit [Hyphomicrobium sp.]
MRSARSERVRQKHCPFRGAWAGWRFKRIGSSLRPRPARAWRASTRCRRLSSSAQCASSRDVRRNISGALRHAVWPKGFPIELQARLDQVGLKSAGQRPIVTFSRDMKQRLELARAMIANPRLIVWDEPAQGLDGDGRRDIHNILLALAEEGTAILIATDSLDDADHIYTRVGIMAGGRLFADGTISTLLAEHAQARRYRLRLAGEISMPAAGAPLPVRIRAREADWMIVDILSAHPTEAVWRDLMFRGWPIVEVDGGGGLQELTSISRRPRARSRGGLHETPRSLSFGASTVCKEAAGVLSTVRGRLRVLSGGGTVRHCACHRYCSTTLKLAGNGWAVAAMLTAATFVGALAAMLSGIDATEGERKRGNLVLLFLTPLSREEIAAGKLGAPAAGALASLVVAVPYLWAMADLQQGLGAAISVLLLFGAPLILAFGVLGFGDRRPIGFIARGCVSGGYHECAFCSSSGGQYGPAQYIRDAGRRTFRSAVKCGECLLRGCASRRVDC